MNRYKDATIEECDVKLKDAIKLAIEEKKGIFVYGNTGVGKTYFCYAVGNTKKIKVENFVLLLSEFRDYMMKGFYNEKVKELCEADYLIIDDIGSEKVTDFVIEFIYTIVNRRYENQKRTILTTNLQFKEFGDRYGDRILSRIAEMCIMVELKGNDKRLN